MIRTVAQDEALNELRSMCAVDAHPKLEETVILGLLESAGRRLDHDGRAPVDEAWVNTYDLDAVAAEAWRRKAALVAGDYSFEADGSRLNRSDVIKHCLQMAQEYTKKIAPIGMPTAVQDPEVEEFPAPEGDA